VKLVSSVEIASGYIHRGDPAAFEIGPTGLAFDSKTHTLYVASTGDNAVYAVHNADTAVLSRGKGTVMYRDNAHLHGPLGLTWAPDGNVIAAQGDAINVDPNQPSELVEFTTSGHFVGQFSISTTEGGAFGVATSSNNEEFAAVNDVTNTVTIWAIVP
jgi:sugar lactone lactonase YvrE